jgi:hypothetical protein
MKVRKGLLAIAAGAILATAGVGYSAPADHAQRNNNRQQGYYTNNESYYGNRTYQGHYGNEQSGWYAQRDDRFDQRDSPRRQSSRERERFSGWEERYER